MIFIVGGAFVDLDKIIGHRVKDGSSIGIEECRDSIVC